MERTHRLLCVLAHPDDESLGTGGILAKYAAEGVETYLITATKGERGWFGDEADNPGLHALGQIREQELYAAAAHLGIQETLFLGYLDGDLEKADSIAVVQQLASHIRRIQPDVVVTFDPFGAYGHPDHVAISRLTTAAVIAAASEGDRTAGQQASHQVKKLYYRASSREELTAYQRVFGNLVMF